jgi:hypothetical protein
MRAADKAWALGRAFLMPPRPAVLVVADEEVTT